MLTLEVGYVGDFGPRKKTLWSDSSVQCADLLIFLWKGKRSLFLWITLRNRRARPGSRNFVQESPPLLLRTLQDSLKQCIQQVVDNIYIIYSEIVEEFGIDVKPGPMYKEEETKFTFKSKTPLIVRGKGESLLVLRVVDCVWNVMAHGQKPDFVFRRNGPVHLYRRERQFNRLLAAEMCASAVVMLYTPCSEVVWRVLATHSNSFPFISPPVRHRVPLHFNWTLIMLQGLAHLVPLECTIRHSLQWGC